MILKSRFCSCAITVIVPNNLAIYVIKLSIIAVTKTDKLTVLLLVPRKFEKQF